MVFCQRTRKKSPSLSSISKPCLTTNHRPSSHRLCSTNGDYAVRARRSCVFWRRCSSWSRCLARSATSLLTAWPTTISNQVRRSSSRENVELQSSSPPCRGRHRISRCPSIGAVVLYFFPSLYALALRVGCAASGAKPLPVTLYTASNICAMRFSTPPPPLPACAPPEHPTAAWVHVQCPLTQLLRLLVFCLFRRQLAPSRRPAHACAYRLRCRSRFLAAEASDVFVFADCTDTSLRRRRPNRCHRPGKSYLRWPRFEPLPIYRRSR